MRFSVLVRKFSLATTAAAAFTNLLEISTASTSSVRLFSASATTYAVEAAATASAASKRNSSSTTASYSAFVQYSTARYNHRAAADKKKILTLNEKGNVVEEGGEELNLNGGGMLVDAEYPGTAVQRLRGVLDRVRQLDGNGELDGVWDDVRRKLLWAGGLRDLPDAVPGQGYTGHCFNDYNHVDLTCMLDQVSDNTNDGAIMRSIAIGNHLGNGIRVASIPELGPGGSWTTCANGCNSSPPKDVAHVQFQSRIAFKLVWIPNDKYDKFVLVDDDGKLLATGKPSMSSSMPPLRQRQMNYSLVRGSKYAKEADKLASNDRVAAE